MPRRLADRLPDRRYLFPVSGADEVHAVRGLVAQQQGAVRRRRLLADRQHRARIGAGLPCGRLPGRRTDHPFPHQEVAQPQLPGVELDPGSLGVREEAGQVRRGVVVGVVPVAVAEIRVAPHGAAEACLFRVVGKPPEHFVLDRVARGVEDQHLGEGVPAKHLPVRATPCTARPGQDRVQVRRQRRRAGRGPADLEEAHGAAGAGERLHLDRHEPQHRLVHVDGALAGRQRHAHGRPLPRAAGDRKHQLADGAGRRRPEDRPHDQRVARMRCRARRTQPGGQVDHAARVRQRAGRKLGVDAYVQDAVEHGQSGDRRGDARGVEVERAVRLLGPYAESAQRAGRHRQVRSHRCFTPGRERITDQFAVVIRQKAHVRLGQRGAILEEERLAGADRHRGARVQDAGGGSPLRSRQPAVAAAVEGAHPQHTPVSVRGGEVGLDRYRAPDCKHRRESGGEKSCTRGPSARARERPSRRAPKCKGGAGPRSEPKATLVGR